MGERRRLFLLILIMTTVSLVVAGITIYVLYVTAFNEERERLVETAQSQARLIEAVARFDVAQQKKWHPDVGVPAEATLSQIIDAHKHYRGFGETGEFTLARRQGDNIVFLLRHRHSDLDKPKPVLFDSKLAEPMRRALSGLSGTVIGPDYRGEKVLAAHEPVGELGLGIVAKIDLAEVRSPFFKAAMVAICAAFLVVLIGAVLFLRVSNPILDRLEERTAELTTANEQLKFEIGERKRAEEALQKAYAEMERRVEERTADLVKANEQLVLEIKERTRVEKALRGSEQQYRLLVENVPSVVYTGFKDWSVGFVDNKIELLTGFSKDEFNSQRMKWSDIIVRDDLERTKRSFIRALKANEPYIREYRIRTKAGDILWLQDRGQIIVDDKSEVEYASGVIFDITASKQTEEEQNLLRRRLEALWEVARMTEASHEQLYDCILTEIIDMTDSCYAFYGFLDADENMMRLHSWSREVLESCRVSDKPLHFPIMNAGVWANAVRERRTLIINDYEKEHPDKKGLPEGHVPLTRILVVPVFSYGRIVSLAAVGNKPTDYTEEDARQIDAFARNVQVIIESQKSREALRESEKELRLLSSQLLTVQENERGRIARELHDGIGQTLSAIKFKIEEILHPMGKVKSEAAAESRETMISMIQEALEEVRRISMDLRPPILDDLGILATCGWFCRDFQNLYSTVRIRKEINIEEADVPGSLKLVIYRVLQEALNNVAKHSEADRVTLSLEKRNNTIVLALLDNGRGFDLEEALSADDSGRGFGLLSMKERVELSGGSFSIESAKGEGTAVRASWASGEVRTT